MVDVEIQAVIETLHHGVPLGEVIAKLAAINDRAIVASYAGGLSLRACAFRHGAGLQHVHFVIKRDMPHLMRLSNKKKGLLKRQAAPC